MSYMWVANGAASWIVPSQEILLRSRLGLMQGDADAQANPKER